MSLPVTHCRLQRSPIGSKCQGSRPRWSIESAPHVRKPWGRQDEYAASRLQLSQRLWRTFVAPVDNHAAHAWLSNLDVSRETREKLAKYTANIVEGTRRHNLISSASIEEITTRHIVDSAQLITLADNRSGRWLDLGSGAGLPGLVIALLTGAPMVLIESRKLRAEFLQAQITEFALDNVTVEARRVEVVPTLPVDVITARAFAPLAKLLPLAARFAHAKTSWILPKGRSAREELASVAATWHGDFTMVPSITDPSSIIIVGHGVRLRAGRRAS